MSPDFNALQNEMKKTLDRHGVRELYHFTAVDNLRGIATRGALWSKEKLESAGLIGTTVTGGNELSLSLDRRLDNWDKVHLYFCPNTPMAYRVQQNPESRDPRSSHICYLVIDQSVALWDNVWFTDTNATQMTDIHIRHQGPQGLQLVDFATIGAHLKGRWVEPKQRWQRNIQAECLVPNEIPLEHINRIAFISKASLREGERIWGNKNHPPFIVDKRLFHSGFPLVNDFLFTSETVTRQNVKKVSFSEQSSFSKKTNSQITLLTKLYATPGTKTKIVWLDEQGNSISQDEIEFEKPNRYRLWKSLDLRQVKEGFYAFDCYLNDTRWFRAHFEIRS